MSSVCVPGLWKCQISGLEGRGPPPGGGGRQRQEGRREGDWDGPISAQLYPSTGFLLYLFIFILTLFEIREISNSPTPPLLRKDTKQGWQNRCTPRGPGKMSRLRFGRAAVAATPRSAGCCRTARQAREATSQPPPLANDSQLQAGLG